MKIMEKIEENETKMEEQRTKIEENRTNIEENAAKILEQDGGKDDDLSEKVAQLDQRLNAEVTLVCENVKNRFDEPETGIVRVIKQVKQANKDMVIRMETKMFLQEQASLCADTMINKFLLTLSNKIENLEGKVRQLGGDGDADVDDEVALSTPADTAQVPSMESSPRVDDTAPTPRRNEKTKPETKMNCCVWVRWITRSVLLLRGK